MSVKYLVVTKSPFVPYDELIVSLYIVTIPDCTKMRNVSEAFGVVALKLLHSSESHVMLLMSNHGKFTEENFLKKKIGKHLSQ